MKLDGIDNYVGGTTMTYGLNNRFYAKRKLQPGAPGQAREIFDVELSQSYYTNQRGAIRHAIPDDAGSGGADAFFADRPELPRAAD